MSLRAVSGEPTRRGGRALRADDLDDPAARARAVELDEEDALPRAEAEVALADGDRLAGRAEQHRHAVRVPVGRLHVLLADVLGAPGPVDVRVVALVRDEAAQERREVLEEAALELVDPHAAGRVRRVHEADAVGDAGLLHELAHVLGDVGHVEATRGHEVALRLEDLHGRESSAAAVGGRTDYAGRERARSSAVRAADS